MHIRTPIGPITNMNLTVVIPTKGRQTLVRCLESTTDAYQKSKADILVVVDMYGDIPQGYMTPEQIRTTCNYFKVRCKFYDAGYNDWGYPQLNFGYHYGECMPYIMNIGDDDVLKENAVEEINSIIRNNGIQPYLFQAELHPSPHRGNKEPILLWNDSNRTIERGKVTGQNLVVPNIPYLFGQMVDDFEFIRSTIARWHGLVKWVPLVTSRCY